MEELEWIATDEDPAPTEQLAKKSSPLAPALVVLALIAALVTALQIASDGDAPPEAATTSTLPPTTAAPAADASPDRTVVAAPTDFPPDGFLRRWRGDEVLAVVEAGASVVLIDLATGGRTIHDPPEPLVAVQPVRAAGGLVVVGETQGWLLHVADGTWAPLGEAADLRASSFEDRVWLARAPALAEDTQTRWDEVGVDGGTVRSVLRSKRLQFRTPELVWTSIHLRKMADEMPIRWQTFSSNAVPIAFGPSDIVVRSCTEQTECELLWYDLATITDRGRLFGDLAAKIPERDWPVLSTDGEYVVSHISPDQRFAVQPTDDLETINVTSIATGSQLALPCRWERPLVWTTGAELVACRSDSGIELYDTTSNQRVGTAWVSDVNAEAHVAFVPRPDPVADDRPATPPVTEAPFEASS